MPQDSLPLSAPTSVVTSPAPDAGPPARLGLVRRFLRQRVPVVALGFLVLLFLVALLAPLLAPYSPNQAHFDHLLEGPSGEFLLGTDNLGRDTLSRLIFATRIAVFAGLEAIVIAVVLGVPIGLLAGYLGGWVDRVVMRVVDVLLSLPGLVVALAIIAALGTGLTNAMLAVGLLFAIRIARLVRGSVLSVREELYVDAAELSGAPRHRVLSRYILPNVTAPLLVEVALYFGIALLIEAMLSFLGVGVQAPQATWGVMLSEARAYVGQQPFLAFPPGVLLTLTVLAFNLTAEGLGSAMGPRSRGVRHRADVREPRPHTPSSEAVLSVNDLSVSYAGEHGDIPILRNVGFELRPREVLGLVGESGSGKSVTALTLMGLEPSGARVSGSIVLDGEQLVGLTDDRFRQLRGNRIAMIFQEPGKALNPSMTVGRQIAEALQIHRKLNRSQARAEAIALLERVGVRNPAERVDDYPHQFSGGMAQRVVIAIALACDPDVLIADEPTTALDVTTQAQVLDLLRSLRDERGLAIVLITHDLGVVADLCDSAAVMYAGEIVEQASVEELFADPRHPYTRALIASTPDDQTDAERLSTIPGHVPRAGHLPQGCAFAPRCALALDECRAERPVLQITDLRAVRCVRASTTPSVESTGSQS